MPSTAAATTPASTPASAPMPMATMDSPRAMSTISPWRSAKWDGASFQCSAPKKYGSIMSSTSARANSPICNAPSANEARISRPTPTAVPPASPKTAERKPGSFRLATMNRTMCAARTTPYAHAKSRPRSPKASGMASETTSRPAMAAKIAKRTTPSSGSTTLVNHA